MTITALVADKEGDLDRATLVLRLVLAAVFLVHGYQKVFVYGFSGVTSSFTHMGVPMPGLIAPVICVLEFGGGVALLFGLFTRIVAVLLACDMLGAMSFVHAKAGFSAPSGIELVIGNFGMLVAIAFLGAGAYSLDAMMARRPAPVP
jgi:putative oxidoreductase